ncbi:MAG: penicillin acylase family protein, partial [Holophagales bacterium]|nr:penicillin acylase family protein [Holophagales bacterium]
MICTASAAQQIELPGLSDDATVVFDSNAVPHICASSEADMMSVLGYVHARDRFFQMDTLRRTFSGTLAEMVGQQALASDVQLRTLGLRRAAERSLAALQAEGLTASLANLDAYTKGVNTFLENNPLPPEYVGLELTTVAPWTPVDSLTMAKGLAFGLSFDLLELDLTVQAGAYAAAGAVGGFDGMALLFEDVNRHAPFDPTVSIPGTLPGARAESSAGTAHRAPTAAAVTMAKQFLAKAKEVPELARAIDPSSHDAGSNWWLIAGDKSATGNPLIANDPHLGLDTPATFYEAHLVVSDQPGCG